MQLLGSIKSKITKAENGENVPHLEITEAALLTVIINRIQESLKVASKVR